MFIPCSEKQGSTYFEFQYCKKEWNIKKLLKKGYSHWEKDSLLIHIDSDSVFFENYAEYLNNSNSPDGMIELYVGVNYYTKEQTFVIIEQIKNDKPQEFDVLVTWLEKAATEYNGFFFLGI